MAARVDVINRALLSLGCEPIVSEADASKPARVAHALYDQVRDEVLRQHPWNCAKARATLAADPAAPAFKWTFRYAFPADCLRVLEVADRAYPNNPWEVEGRFILCDISAPLEITYIRRLDDPNVYDPDFTAAFAAALAYEIAASLTSMSGIVDRAQERAEAKLIAAKIVDGQEELVENIDEDDSWVSARFM